MTRFCSRIGTILFAAVSIAFFASCNIKNKPQNYFPADQPVTLTFDTHVVGSSNYNIAAGLCQMWRRYLDSKITINIKPVSPGGMEAAYLFEKGASIAFVNGAAAKWAYENGTLGKPQTRSFRALAGSLTSVCAVTCVSTDFIQKNRLLYVEEIFTRRLPVHIGCSPVGSMDELCLELLCKETGVTFDDIRSWGGDIIHGDGKTLAALLKNGEIEMIIDHTSAQSSTMAELAATAQVTFMQWQDTTLSYFYNAGFERVILPADSFTGQTKDIVCAGSPDCLFVNKDMSDDIAYALTKGLCEQRNNLAKQYSSLEPFNPATSWRPEKCGSVPLHPGAERYYREAGYMK